MSDYSNKFWKILISNSKSSNWYEALKEWNLSFIDYEEDNCICGHKIYEKCYIRNIHTNNTLIVGNICILKFLNKDLSWYFKAIKSIKQFNFPNKKFMSIFIHYKLFSNYEIDFYNNFYNKRKLSKTNKLKKIHFCRNILIKLELLRIIYQKKNL